MTSELPPQFIFAADQGYAQAQERLNELVSDLASNMAARSSRQDDAAPWAASVMMMMNIHERDGGFATSLIEVWQAALYRLARQQLGKKDK